MSKRNPALYRKFMTSSCEACGDNWLLDPDHVKTFGSGGENSEHNIMTLCRIHHIEKGRRGVKFMSDKYPRYHNWLIAHGWEWVSHLGKWIRYADQS